MSIVFQFNGGSISRSGAVIIGESTQPVAGEYSHFKLAEIYSTRSYNSLGFSIN